MKQWLFLPALIFGVFTPAMAWGQNPATPALAKPEGARSVEVTIPNVVEAGQEFPIIYRATPKRGVQLQTLFATKSRKSEIGQGRVTDAEISASRSIRRGVLETPGYFLLTFQFKNRGDETLMATARTKVLPSAEYKALYGAKEWVLPRKNLYFSTEKFAAWNALPEAQRTIIALERTSFSPLLEQTDYDNSWYPTRAWNQLNETLQPRWIPPLSLVRGFENSSYYPPTKVAYAAWSQDGLNFIYQWQEDGQAWLYLETQGATPSLDSLFLPTFLQRANAGKNSNPTFFLLARTMARHRALMPDAASEPVNVWLVKMGLANALDLRFPSYQAPESPRLALPKVGF